MVILDLPKLNPTYPSYDYAWDVSQFIACDFLHYQGILRSDVRFHIDVQDVLPIEDDELW
jgi:hypothetical protein